MNASFVKPMNQNVRFIFDILSHVCIRETKYSMVHGAWLRFPPGYFTLLSFDRWWTVRLRIGYADDSSSTVYWFWTELRIPTSGLPYWRRMRAVCSQSRGIARRSFFVLPRRLPCKFVLCDAIFVRCTYRVHSRRSCTCLDQGCRELSSMRCSCQKDKK